MVSHKRKKPSLTSSQKSSVVASSLAHRKILPQSAPCRQRYNAAFQALQNAYSCKHQAVKHCQNMGAADGEAEETAAPPMHLINEDDLTQLKRNLANYRERWRTEELNEAYKQLRRIVPSMPSDKMSKIHTLRIAADYIRFLDQTCRSLDSCWTTVLICSSSSSFEVSASSTTAVEHVRANFNAWRAELAAATICQQRQQTELSTGRDPPKIEFESTATLCPFDYRCYVNEMNKEVKTSGQVDFEGSFGKVSIGFLMGENGLRCVAVKVLKNTDENNKYYEKSIGVAKKIVKCLGIKRRRHLIEMIDAGVRKHDDLLIIMELGDETFHDRLYNRTESYENDRDWMQAIENLAQPLKEFHQVAIHMDIKATNYLYVPKNGQMLLKLIDFDGAQLIDYSNKNAAITADGWVFTTQYCAPEFYGRETQISRKFDIWSLGMVIFEVFVDKLRQEHGNESLNLDDLSRFLIDIGDLYAKFKQPHVNRTLRSLAIPYLGLKDWSYNNVIEVVLQFWLKFPKTALLVTNMLHPNRQKRITAKGILDYINGLCHIRDLEQ
uniref:Protein kinase domain-containing protein n=1 Tax=Globodera rostochiensis TaxID=31243 RepID=A0A914HX28_GLORO